MSDDRHADDIRSAMARLRRDADLNAEVMLARARQMTDWRYHVRQHPKLTLLSVAALGYLLVPSKQKAKPRSRQSFTLFEGEQPEPLAAQSTWEPLIGAAAKAILRNGLPFLAHEAMRWWQHRSAESPHGNGRHPYPER